MVVQGYRGKAYGGRVDLKPFRAIYDTWEQTPEQRLFGCTLTWLLILPSTHAPKFHLFSDIVLYTAHSFSGHLVTQLLLLAVHIIHFWRVRAAFLVVAVSYKARPRYGWPFSAEPAMDRLYTAVL